MKKKYFLLLLVLSLLLSLLLTACGEKKQLADMTIAPSEFSEETTEELDVIGGKLFYFDYKVDETIKSAAVAVWFYENGEWKPVGETIGDVKVGKNRMALSIDENSYDIITINESGYSTVGINTTSDFDKSKMAVTSHLSYPTAIEADKEMTLWVKTGTDKDEVHTTVADDFRKSDCNAGTAVTITFSSKAAE